MNKQELIERVADKTKTTKGETETMINTIVEIIVKAVKSGHDVKIVGFGTITKTKSKARNGRNPRTGESIKIPAAWRPKFRAGRDFKTLVNQ